MFSKIKMLQSEDKKIIAINDGTKRIWKMYSVKGDNYTFFACSIPKSSNPTLQQLYNNKL